jgi:hypothetical protein
VRRMLRMRRFLAIPSLARTVLVRRLHFKNPSVGQGFKQDCPVGGFGDRT